MPSVAGCWSANMKRSSVSRADANLGNPYIACFKTCVSDNRGGMNKPKAGFYPEDQLAVVLDRNEFQTQAVDISTR